MNIYFMEQWYTYTQIIQKFGICKQTLNNWRRNGNIEYRKITNRTFMYKLPESKTIKENEKV